MPALVRALNLMLERTIVCLEKVTSLIYEKNKLPRNFVVIGFFSGVTFLFVKYN